MKISNIIYSKGRTGFYFDDQVAIKAGAKKDGMFYEGDTHTDGFQNIRIAGESISIMLILEDGQVAHGDCAAVQYSGTGGRDSLFMADEFIKFLKENISPLLINTEVTNFKQLAEHYDNLKINGKRLHTALRYGITQALLDARSKVCKKTMAEVINEEYNKNQEIKILPIFGQSGDDRYTNVDKMIIKGADILPHALINNMEEKLGKNGEKLKEYVDWLKNRIIDKRIDTSYKPVFHIDVYGTPGIAFDYDINDIYEYLVDLTNTAHPFKLRIEGVVDCGNKEETITIFSELTKMIDKNNINCELVADEWCNNLQDIKDFADRKAGHVLQIKTPDLGGINNIAEAILYCNKLGLGSYSGGTCNETNRSAEITTNVAMALGALQVLAKPGMGFDEGFMIVYNEMQRVMARINNK